MTHARIELMCGRYNFRAKPFELVELLGFRISDQMELDLRYNIAPTQTSIFAIGEERECREGRWGLVPPFIKNVSKMGQPLINARAETIAEKPSFRAAFSKRRCLVPASGFYEWLREGKTKTPYHIHRADDHPFCMAGLWEVWKRDEKVIESFTIITTAANDLMQPIHDRMPVILDLDEIPVWMDPASPVEALQMLTQPRNWDGFEITPANPLVNSWKNDVPECLSPPLL